MDRILLVQDKSHGRNLVNWIKDFETKKWRAISIVVEPILTLQEGLCLM
jgi:hypothetical protein